MTTLLVILYQFCTYTGKYFNNYLTYQCDQFKLQCYSSQKIGLRRQNCSKQLILSHRYQVPVDFVSILHSRTVIEKGYIRGWSHFDLEKRTRTNISEIFSCIFWHSNTFRNLWFFVASSVKYSIYTRASKISSKKRGNLRFNFTVAQKSLSPDLSFQFSKSIIVARGKVWTVRVVVCHSDTIFIRSSPRRKSGVKRRINVYEMHQTLFCDYTSLFKGQTQLLQNFCICCTIYRSICKK